MKLNTPKLFIFSLIGSILNLIGRSYNLETGRKFGDGITNMFWFSYGTLMIFLTYGKVSIQKWWKFFVPLMIAFFVLAFAALAVAIGTGF